MDNCSKSNCSLPEAKKCFKKNELGCMYKKGI
jgi:hypothetical protein